VVAAKRSKANERTQWTGRLAGLALCSFFAFGVLTGLSSSGQDVAARLQRLLPALRLFPPRLRPHPPTAEPAADAIALVEHPDGFYQLDTAGALHGPVASSTVNDLPIMSGAALADASAQRLLDYASIIVRAEAGLGLRISEMRIEGAATATLFLDRPPLPITLDLDHAPVEIAHAAQVLTLWQAHWNLLAALDLTVPGEAVARLRPAAFQTPRRDRATSLNRVMARRDLRAEEAAPLR